MWTEQRRGRMRRWKIASLNWADRTTKVTWSSQWWSKIHKMSLGWMISVGLAHRWGWFHVGHVDLLIPTTRICFVWAIRWYSTLLSHFTFDLGCNCIAKTYLIIPFFILQFLTINNRFRNCFIPKMRKNKFIYTIVLLFLANIAI